jgi:hypothetical protein
MVWAVVPLPYSPVSESLFFDVETDPHDDCSISDVLLDSQFFLDVLELWRHRRLFEFLRLPRVEWQD